MKVQIKVLLLLIAQTRILPGNTTYLMKTYMDIYCNHQEGLVRFRNRLVRSIEYSSRKVLRSHLLYNGYLPETMFCELVGRLLFFLNMSLTVNMSYDILIQSQTLN